MINNTLAKGISPRIATRACLVKAYGPSGDPSSIAPKGPLQYGLTLHTEMGSNHRPTVLETVALPAELSVRVAPLS
jgi:hypothetical protein